MPTNLYGPGDNYHPEYSHVIPALIRRFHDAKQKKLSEVCVWGSGEPRREFLFVDDLAEAALFVMGLSADIYRRSVTENQTHVNVGTGIDCSIAELAALIAHVVGYRGKIVWDRTKPDGTPKKCLDTKLINGLGWIPEMDLERGLEVTYRSYLRENSMVVV